MTSVLRGFCSAPTLARVEVDSQILACAWEEDVGFCQRAPRAPSTHCSHILRMSLVGAFVVLFAPTFSAEDKLREGQEVCPGWSVVVGGDSCEGGHKAPGPGFLGGLRHVGPEQDPRGDWRAGVQGSFDELGDGIVRSRVTLGELSVSHSSGIWSFK